MPNMALRAYTQITQVQLRSTAGRIGIKIDCVGENQKAPTRGLTTRAEAGYREK
jgi:hypothetical protein